MPHLTFDQWLHVAEMLSFIFAIGRGGLTFRDTVRDHGKSILDLRTDVNDHEDRLRVIEGKPMRRTRDEPALVRRPFLGIF